MGIIFFILATIVLEIITWVMVGKWVGSGWYVFVWFVVAFFIGLNMLRYSMKHIKPQLQQMQTGSMGVANDPALAKYLPFAIAGILLMIPGLWTDLVAVLLLIPQVRNGLKRSIMGVVQRRQAAMMQQMMGGMGQMGAGGMGSGQNPFEEMMRQMQQMQQGQRGGHSSTIIEGEAKEVTPEVKRIEMDKKD